MTETPFVPIVPDYPDNVRFRVDRVELVAVGADEVERIALVELAGARAQVAWLRLDIDADNLEAGANISSGTATGPAEGI